METFDCRWKKVFTDIEFSWSWTFDHEISETYRRSNLLPFNSHYSYFGSDPESKAFLWQTFEQHYAFHLHTNVRPHRWFCNALTLPRVKQTSVQQGEILANILSAYNKKNIVEAVKWSRLYPITKCVLQTLLKLQKSPSDSVTPTHLQQQRGETEEKTPPWDPSGDLSPL